MLHVFRETIGKYVAIAIIALIAVTFVFWGIDFSITQTSYAARVNGESIPIAEFNRVLRLEQTEIQRLMQDELTDEMRVQIRQSVIDEMVARELLVQRAEEAGYRVSDQRVVQSLQNDPQFQVGGTFSQDVYVSLLAQQGLTPAGWEARQRELLTIVDWQNGLFESAFVTPAEFRRQIELLFERREIAYARFPVNDFLDEVEISDEEVAEYHAANGDAFMTAEAVDIEFVELDLPGIAETVEISEAELREHYETEIESYAASEERQVSHILIEPEGDDTAAAEAEAEAIMERLEAGADFAELAAEASDDVGTRNVGGDLGYMARGSFEGAFEDVLFSMEVGEIAGPVETEFGFHILRLEDIRASDVQPFEAVRDQLRSQLAEEEAYSLFYDQANELANDAYDARDELASVAEEFGLELETIEGLTRSGNTERFANPAPVIEAAFDDEAIASGENSDLIELSEERVIVLRVSAHHLPEPQPLEAVTEEIRSILSREAAAALASEAATAYVEALEADSSVASEEADALNESDEADEADEAEQPDSPLVARAEALADEHGASWSAPQWIRRNSAEVAAGIASLVFAQPKPASGQPEAILRTSVGGADQVVVLFTGVQAGVPGDISVTEREQGQERFREAATGVEINAFVTDARQEATVRVPDQVLDPEL